MKAEVRVIWAVKKKTKQGDEILTVRFPTRRLAQDYVDYSDELNVELAAEGLYEVIGLDGPEGLAPEEDLPPEPTEKIVSGIEHTEPQ